jgi:ABC-type protease/lipase transport system fused ATPase/permease subunit
MTVGDLVAMYGDVAVLVVPVSFFIQGGSQLTSGLVGTRRIIRFLNLEPDPVSEQATRPVPPSPSPSVLRDPESGVEVAPGRLTALVSARSAESAAVVDRLGRFAGSTATWGAVRLDEIALGQVRERILIADNEADLFAGTLRDIVAGRSERSDEAISGALQAAMAQDIVLGLPEGLDSFIDAQGRNLSGGQRQRVRLVRALLAEPRC